MLRIRHLRNCLENNMKCWHCGNDLIWGGDHDIDDDGDDFPLRGEGIVTNLSCSNDGCNTHVEVYHYYNLDEDEEE